jgi:hypothetical protein
MAKFDYKPVFNLATNFALPVEAATETIAIVARRGAGKTYTARKLAEGLLIAGIPTVIVDPIGVCWGLRASADGKGPGLPIYVLGGEHGDAPLTPDSGKVVADLVNAENLSVVLDLSLLRKGESNRFVTDFAERLYHVRREVMHLIIDEADAFAPQRPMPGEARMLGAMEDLVRRGRARGIGMTLITQRPAVINKNVLTQCEILIALQMSHPRDLNAVDEWVKLHGTDEQRAAFLKSVPGLQRGQAWIWSPSFLNVFLRIDVDRCHTFDSSATPKAGAAKVKAPKQLAAVDLDKLRETLAAQISLAESEDPRKLQAKIARLEGELAQMAAPNHEQIADAVQLEAKLWRDQLAQTLSEFAEAISLAMEKTTESQNILIEAYQKTRAMPKVRRNNSTERIIPRIPDPEPRHKVLPDPVGAVIRGELAKAQRLILTALAQQGPRTKSQVAVLTGYSGEGGGFRNSIGALRTAGLLVDQGDRLAITLKGQETLGRYEPLPRGPALVEWWNRKLGKCERAILAAVVQAYPRSMHRAEIARVTEYEVEGGGFRNSLGKLRTLELVSGYTEITANPELCQ